MPNKDLHFVEHSRYKRVLYSDYGYFGEGFSVDGLEGVDSGCGIGCLGCGIGGGGGGVYPFLPLSGLKGGLGGTYPS